VVRGGLPGRGIGAEIHRALRRRPRGREGPRAGRLPVQYIDYDWNLNGTPPRR
jgi:hypothetical protein